MSVQPTDFANLSAGTFSRILIGSDKCRWVNCDGGSFSSIHRFTWSQETSEEKISQACCFLVAAKTFEARLRCSKESKATTTTTTAKSSSTFKRNSRTASQASKEGRNRPTTCSNMTQGFQVELG